jgi:hypothetical protein
VTEENLGPLAKPAEWQVQARQQMDWMKTLAAPLERAPGNGDRE